MQQAGQSKGSQHIEQLMQQLEPDSERYLRDRNSQTVQIVLG